MSRTIRIVANIENEARRIITIKERPSGDVYLEVHCGSQIGTPPDHKIIKQQKYSLHVSANSNEFNSFKTTLRVDDEPEVTAVNLNDAIKSKVGFGYLFVGVYNKLIGRQYDLPPGDRDDVIEITSIDRSRALAVGIFVGDKDTKFLSHDANISVHSVLTNIFNIAILTGVTNRPPTDFGIFDSYNTLDPEKAYGQLKSIRRGAMRSLSPEDCIDIFKGMVPAIEIDIYTTTINSSIKNGRKLLENTDLSKEQREMILGEIRRAELLQSLFLKS